MRKQVETLAYLGGKASFTHEAVLWFQENHPQYQDVKLIPTKTIEETCRMVAEGETSYGVVPAENSTDGAVGDTLKEVKKYPLFIHYEHGALIRQSLYYRRDADPAKIAYYGSKDSAIGQTRRTIPQILPNAIAVLRNSTVEAILDAAENPNFAGIGPSIVGEEYDLMGRMIRIDDVNDDPFNATRFWLIANRPSGNYVTGADKTSFIAQMPDKAGALYSVLDILMNQGINLTKIKSFGRKGGDSSFLMTLQGHKENPSLKAAIRSLSTSGTGIKMLGSYPQSDYQSTRTEEELDAEFAIERLRQEVNGAKENDQTVIVFTLKDKVGALRNALEPFSRRRINLTEIDSLASGELEKIFFYLAFQNGANQKAQAIEELTAQCTRVVLL